MANYCLNFVHPGGMHPGSLKAAGPTGPIAGQMAQTGQLILFQELLTYFRSGNGGLKASISASPTLAEATITGRHQLQSKINPFSRDDL